MEETSVPAKSSLKAVPHIIQLVHSVPHCKLFFIKCGTTCKVHLSATRPSWLARQSAPPAKNRETRVSRRETQASAPVNILVKQHLMSRDTDLWHKMMSIFMRIETSYYISYFINNSSGVARPDRDWPSFKTQRDQ